MNNSNITSSLNKLRKRYVIAAFISAVLIVAIKVVRESRNSE